MEEKWNENYQNLFYLVSQGKTIDRNTYIYGWYQLINRCYRNKRLSTQQTEKWKLLLETQKRIKENKPNPNENTTTTTTNSNEKNEKNEKNENSTN